MSPKRAGHFLLLIALLLSTTEAHAQLNRIRLDPWPAGVPLPNPKEVFTPFVAGGVPSDNRKVIGIYATDAAGNAYICSGALLTRKFVLTAAHCTCDPHATAPIQKYGVTNDQAVLNQTNNHQAADATWYTAKLASVFGGYDCSLGPRGGNDLALLEVTSGFMLANDSKLTAADWSAIPSVVPAAQWMTTLTSQMRVEGYGYNGNESNSLGLRRSALVEVDSIGCTESWVQWTGCSVLYEFVLGLRPTEGKYKDTCAGDSGGPVFNGNNLVGTVSRGVPTSQRFALGECGAGGIYTHLGRRDVIAWLKANSVEAAAPRAGLN
jgi:secreted trypsin-like serine protease